MQGGAVAGLRTSGYTSVVLDRLAMQVRRILAADQSLILLRDRSDPDFGFAVAGEGVERQLIGERMRLSDLDIGSVVSSGEPILLEEKRAAAHNGVTGGAAPITWEGHVRGAVAAKLGDGERHFGERELEILCQLAELAAAALQHSEQHERLEPIVEAGVEALAAAIDMRDGYTSEHSAEVVELAGRVGRRLGLEPAALVELECAARLHDVGKIGVPDEILRKPGPLEESEWRTIKRHPERGAEVLSRIPGLEAVATIVRFHHERWDGSGYPDGLAGDAIPLASRVISACDAFRAMTSDRPYRAALETWRALEELKEHSGSQFDPKVVDALLEVI
jgi:HD-GYP domain-containing protein (c-di-GMP phosphodiesterase class II)